MTTIQVFIMCRLTGKFVFLIHCQMNLLVSYQLVLHNTYMYELYHKSYKGSAMDVRNNASQDILHNALNNRIVQ